MDIRSFSYSAKCAKSFLISVTNGPKIQKTSRYVLSKQGGTEYTKIPSRATVPTNSRAGSIALHVIC